MEHAGKSLGEKVGQSSQRPQEGVVRGEGIDLFPHGKESCLGAVLNSEKKSNSFV